MNDHDRRLTEDALQLQIDRVAAAAALPRADRDLALRNLDTPENRAFWASVRAAVEAWDAQEPEWSRAVRVALPRAPEPDLPSWRWLPL
jgi:hypothetical protein